MRHRVHGAGRCRRGGLVRPTALQKLGVFSPAAGCWAVAMGCIATAIKASAAVAVVGWSTGSVFGIAAIVLLVARAANVVDHGWGRYIAPRECPTCTGLAAENLRLRETVIALDVRR